MGNFNIDIEIGDTTKELWTKASALVDTGATMTSAPASLFRQLGIEPVTKRLFEFAQGEVRLMDIGYAWLRLEGQEIITQVLFNDEGTTPLLGALALEEAFLGVDPVAQKLIPVRGII